jgi:hypothetical protein
MRTPYATTDELDALLAQPTTAQPTEPPPEWLRSLCTRGDMLDLDDDDLCEIAAECDPRGIQATIAGLIEAVRVRHAADRVTLAMLAALHEYHMPRLVDELRRN